MEQKVLRKITTVVGESLARIEKEIKNFAKIEVFNTAEDLEKFLIKTGCERSEKKYPAELIADLVHNPTNDPTKFIIAGYCLSPVEPEDRVLPTDSTYWDVRIAIDTSDNEKSTFRKLCRRTKISNKFSMEYDMLCLENRSIL